MESITKNRQSATTLRAMVERAYGPGQVPSEDGFAEELGHGWFNVAYLVRLRDGARVVLKIAPAPHVDVMTYEREMMRNEIAAVALIQSRTEVPVPTIDFADLSHELTDADYFFMPFIDADNLGILQENGEVPGLQSEYYSEQLGKLNRDLNAVRGAHFGALEGPGFVRPRPLTLASPRNGPPAFAGARSTGREPLAHRPARTGPAWDLSAPRGQRDQYSGYAIPVPATKRGRRKSAR